VLSYIKRLLCRASAWLYDLSSNFFIRQTTQETTITSPRVPVTIQLI